MTDPHEQRDGEPQVEAPQSLAHDLARVFGSAPSVPASVDDKVMTMARKRFARVRRVRTLVRLGGVAAAAAAMFLAVVIFGMREKDVASRATLQPAAREDIDANGSIDILDAFALARSVDAGRGRAEWDVTGDGAVDRGDVDAVARVAVSLSRNPER